MADRFRIETPRLRLCPLTHQDAATLHRVWTAPAVRRYLWDDQVIPEEQTTEIIATSRVLFEQRGFGLWTMRLRDEDALIGFCGFWFFRDPPERELLIGLAPEHWGQGLAPEAGRALLRFAFEELRLPEVRASTDAPNCAAARVMEKLGMTFDRRATVGGLDTLFYQIQKAKWGRLADPC